MIKTKVARINNRVYRHYRFQNRFQNRFQDLWFRGLLLITLLVSSLLSACSKEDAYILGPQLHDDVEVLVEIRPGAPRVGMNEFIVVATHKNRIPAKDYIVSIMIQGFGEWRQSIQDGHSGVYRRAVRVNDPQTDVLLVQLDKKGEKTTLSFPLTPK